MSIHAKEPELFYIQDSRSYCGNAVFWWGPNSAGYTSKIESAGTYTREEAFRQYACRETDIPWPKEYIDARTYRIVDAQYLDMKDTGIILPELPKRKKPKHSKRCGWCGAFTGDNQSPYDPCDNCNEDHVEEHRIYGSML